LKIDAFKSKVYSPDGIKRVLCLKRNKRVPASPEEFVRQRVLNWLFTGKKISHELVDVEVPVTFSSETTKRADIVVKLDRKIFVIECKKPSYPLGVNVELQAAKYADRLKASGILLTNGDEHRLFIRKKDGWTETNRWPEFGEKFRISRIPTFSETNLKDAEVLKVIRKMPHMQRFNSKNEVIPVASLLRLILAPQEFYGALPFSHQGVHILEDRGLHLCAFGNRGHGSDAYSSYYRLFLAATEGSVETIAIGINEWGDGTARICVGAITQSREHHTLQAQLSVEIANGKYVFFHDGSMSQVKSATVLDAVTEAGRKDLLVRSGKGELLKLGALPHYNDVDWRTSKVFLANLIHYGLIRTGLREHKAA
jgi:hypothetical protein